MNRGRPFEPGNKFGRGRPPGSRNRKAQALQKVLDEYTPALLRKSLAMALQGDVPLLKMFMDRRLPKSSGAPVRIGRLLSLLYGPLRGCAETAHRGSRKQRQIRNFRARLHRQRRLPASRL